MIKYKCTACQAKLETEDSSGGAKEQCPACGELNTVPLNKTERAKRKAQQKEQRKVRQRLQKMDNAIGAAEVPAPDQSSESSAVGKPGNAAVAGRAQHQKPGITVEDEPKTQTEWACRLLAWGSGGTGVAVAVFTLTTLGERPELILVLLMMAAPLAAGIAGTVFWLALEQLLRHLRRIMDAAEGRGGKQVQSFRTTTGGNG